MHSYGGPICGFFSGPQEALESQEGAMGNASSGGFFWCGALGIPGPGPYALSYWLMTICEFQVYNIVIQRLYTLLHAHHPKSSFLMSIFLIKKNIGEGGW